jgi:RNA polymerase sigma-70 factor (ECF subfamily)
MEIKKFKILVLPLRSKLNGYACKLLDNTEDAQDATQEVMMKLWERRDELEKYHSIEAFAMTLIHNTCIDMQRTKKTNLPLIETLNEDFTTSAEHLLEIRSEVELVKQIIEALPDIQRLTIQMKDVEGYENEEIAEIIGGNVETVRSNLSRARKKVRDMYLQIMKERINK